MMLQASAMACERSAGTLLLSQLLAAEGPLMMPLLPYAALLTVPTLALMTDPEVDVRTTAAAAFGRLMSILPMTVNQPLPELTTLDATLREKRKNDLRLMEQLLDSRSVQDFEPHVNPQGVTLRAYQREGVSWLAFLQKFGLHGVLADDMGLGKTVQTLTIIACSMAPPPSPTQASDAPNGSAVPSALPSLIVCPATLLGHWVQETQRYFGHIGLRTVRYQGTADQRQALQRQVRGGVIAVASYESVRQDISWFAGVRFQYCALDEGHIIRNSKTKVTQACKKVQYLSLDV
jgi:TATA-binding protein-associated factor